MATSPSVTLTNGLCVLVDSQAWCLRDGQFVSLEGGAPLSLDRSAGATCSCMSSGELQCWHDLRRDACSEALETPAGALERVRPPIRCTSATVLGSSVCVLDDVGHVACWPRLLASHTPTQGPEAIPTTPSDAVGRSCTASSWAHATSDVARLAGGDDTGCALHTDGTIDCWGLNRRGQTSDGVMTGGLVRVPIAGATDVDVNAAGGCAIHDGEVWCWGFGASALSTEERRACHEASPWHVPPSTPATLLDLDVAPCRQRTPRAIQGLIHARRVRVGHEMACAVMDDGDAYCWASSDPTESGEELRPLTPTLVAHGVRDIALDYRQGCLLNEAFELWCWGFREPSSDASSEATHATEWMPPGHLVARISDGRPHLVESREAAP